MDLPELVELPYSFFALAAKYNDIKPLKRALSILRQHDAKTMTREVTIVPREQWMHDEDEPEAFQKITNEPVSELHVHTLSFYKNPFTQLEELPQEIDEMLGRIVLKGFVCATGTTWIVKECILRPQNRADSYVCAFGRHALPAAKPTGTMEAAVHCQQTIWTNCCAHASIRMALGCLPSFAGTPPTHRNINQQLVIDHVIRKASGGLKAFEIADVLSSAHVRPIVYDFSPNSLVKPRLPAGHLIYLGVESGFPVILGFHGGHGGHVVTVIGHTFNGSNWLPEADLGYALEISKHRLGYLPSAGWADNFILQDDNFGPYYCVTPAFMLDKITLVTVVTDLQPTECFADEAEIVAVGALPAIAGTAYATSSANWTQILFRNMKMGKLIARTTLATRSSYLTELSSHRVIGAASEDGYRHLSNRLPDRVWITEVSVPELFSANRAKIAEIVVNPADATVLVARMPGAFLFPLPSSNPQSYEVATNAMEGYLPLRGVTRGAV
jgi:hypothetical protein